MSAIATLDDSKANYPIWSLRPGLVEVISPAAFGLDLWKAIRSVNGLEMKPCLLEEKNLARLLGHSDRKAARSRLGALRKVPGLLLEVERGYSQAPIQRPKARWATDPLRAEYWFPVISNRRLPRMAHADGLGSRWLAEAREHLSHHALAANALRDALVAELGHPCAISVQYAGGVEGRANNPGPEDGKKEESLGGVGDEVPHAAATAFGGWRIVREYADIGRAWCAPCGCLSAGL